MRIQDHNLLGFSPSLSAKLTGLGKSKLSLPKGFYSIIKILSVSNLENLQTYYSLYSAIQEKSRFRLKYIAKVLRIGGRGETYTTASNYISKLYEKQISLRPNLILRTFENCFTKAYFLNVANSRDITSTYLKLSNNRQLSYMLLLSGKYDFFVTSKYDLTFEGLIVKKKSTLFTPIYTTPTGWEKETKDAFRTVANSSPEKGKLERIMEDWLPWDEIHFKIFEILKNNVQLPFSRVAKEVNLSQTTVKRYFDKYILPHCNIAHYFFPKGYPNYRQSLIILKSKYERGLIDSFCRLPCTTYVFPLEKEIVLGVFHEGVNDLMFTFKKLEEKGFVDRHLLLVPLSWE